MSDPRDNPMLDAVRELYNAPTETPDEEMWQAIEARLDERDKGRDPEVVDLAEVRRQRADRWNRPLGWAVAAAAVLVLGVGIGRMTSPGTSPEPVAERAAPSPGAALTFVAQETLGRTESLLTMVRADARSGRLDPSTALWARTLLVETRMLMDARPGDQPTVDELLLDLELVLIQIVGVAEGTMDEERLRTELDLAVRSLEDQKVLSRIQAVLPSGVAGA